MTIERHMKVCRDIADIIQTDEDGYSALTSTIYELYHAGERLEEITMVIMKVWNHLEDVEEHQVNGDKPCQCMYCRALTSKH